jgi:hypothetical protein
MYHGRCPAVSREQNYEDNWRTWAANANGLLYHIAMLAWVRRHTTLNRWIASVKVVRNTQVERTSWLLATSRFDRCDRQRPQLDHHPWCHLRHLTRHLTLPATVFAPALHDERYVAPLIWPDLSIPSSTTATIGMKVVIYNLSSYHEGSNNDRIPTYDGHLYDWRAIGLMALWLGGRMARTWVNQTKSWVEGNRIWKNPNSGTDSGNVRQLLFRLVLLVEY